MDILKERKTEHDKYRSIFIDCNFVGSHRRRSILYLALAGLAIIYSMGANESPKGRRIFFGVLGVVMIVAFVCASIYLHKYGWPL